MLEIILLIMVFIMGIYFGSFYTLATYRIPKGENIINKHSYCPNCNHKLGIKDLVPIFSYIFLGGKCRYCKNKIGSRYFIFEFLTGIVFVLFAISLKINVYKINITTFIYFFIMALYFTFLFILAGIEKEQSKISNSVLLYGICISIIYIIYSYTLKNCNVYEYVIYLILLAVLMCINITYYKKKLQNNYVVQILIILLCFLICSGIYRTIYGVVLAIFAIILYKLLTYLKNKKGNIVKKTKKTPIAFFLCISNILVIIVWNFIINYMMI